jgi:hypothetical protein
MASSQKSNILFTYYWLDNEMAVKKVVKRTDNTRGWSMEKVAYLLAPI